MDNQNSLDEFLKLQIYQYELQDETGSLHKAKEYFEKAHANFKKLNHLRGQCLALQNISKVSERIPGSDVRASKDELEKASQNYFKYVHEVGI